jgi:thiamine biosynthesis lipoprotein ApbE
LLAALIGATIGPRPVTFRHENVLGTSLELKVQARSQADAELAESVVLAEIDRLAKVVSSYDPASEFSRWASTRGEAVRVSPELAELLTLWDRWSAETGGALNPATETAARLWRGDAIPSAESLAAAAAQMRGPHWKLAGDTATRLGSAPLRLNSFTKSWIIEKASAAALATGVVDGLTLNIGGDLVTRGSLTETVAIANPRDDAENAVPLGTLQARNLAVATSGDYRRGFTVGGQRYSHIIDPRTALPAAGVISATVVSPDAVEAGALATAFNVLDPAESARVAARHPRAEYLLIAASGERFASRGWGALFASQVATASALADVQIQFELARIDAGRYRRPFVAVWVEDKDKFPVRTVAVWYDRPRWLPDLRAWSRADRLRSMAEGTEIIGSVSSATRPPGKYTVKWDGKDQAGKPVKPGKYTVFIEAAREHGTYQLLKQEIDLTAPQSFPLAGGTEIAAASVEVKKTR